MNLFPGLLSRMNDDNGFLMGFDLIRVNSRRKWNAETSNAGPVHPNSLRSRVKVSSLRRNIAISPTLQRSIHGHCPVTSTIEAKCDVRDRYVDGFLLDKSAFCTYISGNIWTTLHRKQHEDINLISKVVNRSATKREKNIIVTMLQT